MYDGVDVGGGINEIKFLTFKITKNEHRHYYSHSEFKCDRILL
jgi:hypothetical protein